MTDQTVAIGVGVAFTSSVSVTGELASGAGDADIRHLCPKDARGIGSRSVAVPQTRD